jgi:hypothetical protein
LAFCLKYLINKSFIAVENKMISVTESGRLAQTTFQAEEHSRKRKRARRQQQQQQQLNEVQQLPLPQQQMQQQQQRQNNPGVYTLNPSL